MSKIRDWEGKKYEELAPNLRTLFREYKIKIIAYTVENPIDVSDEDLEYVGRDLFRRYNSGTTPLKTNEIIRAKYHYDSLTNKFTQLFENKSELYNECIHVFRIGEKKEIEEREKLNLLLIIVRYLITIIYIPIIGEKKPQCNQKIIDKYYNEFITKYTEKEQEEKLVEFERIFRKLYLIKEKLTEMNNILTDNTEFFRSTYWMFSILYNNFSTNFYDFNVDKFCHNLQDKGKEYFEMYNNLSGHDTEKRVSYMKEYMEKELKLDLSNYIDGIKENKKAVIYKKDTNISKDKDWYSPFLSQQIITRKETMELSEITSHIKQNRFIVRPDYQRGEVFDKTKASRVIESIILGVKLPPIYLYTERQKNGLSTDIVLDGQQRLIDILKYMGEPVTDQEYRYIKTFKDKYPLKGLRYLEGLNNKVYEEGPDSINRIKREIINNYIFDVIRIDKKGNENIDFVDIFIRLNQNPCPININSFEMWNSFDIVDTIDKIKEIAKYKGFKQQRSAMKEEEIVTILAYMYYIKLDIENINDFFKFDIRTDNKDTTREKSLIRISVKNKEAITNFLEKIQPNSEKEKEFLISVNLVSDFVEKLKILSDNDDKTLTKLFNTGKSKNIRVDKNCFYIMWLILHELDEHIIRTYKKEMLVDLEKIFSLMQNMPKDKNEKDFIDYVSSLIRKYSK